MSNCKYCGKEYDRNILDSKKFPVDFCCYSCYENYQKFNHDPNCKCAVCGKDLYIKSYRLNRLVDKDNITCCKDCSNKLKSITFSGSNNHQFGLKGDKNSSFKGNIIEHQGYLYEYDPTHPKCDSYGRVRQHRLIVEQNWNNYDEKYFSIINNRHILKDEYDVHHKNKIKTDNSLDNLDILSREEHSRIHATEMFLENENIRSLFKKNWR